MSDQYESYQEKQEPNSFTAEQKSSGIQGLPVFIIVCAAAILFFAASFFCLNKAFPRKTNFNPGHIVWHSIMKHDYMAVLHITGVIEDNNETYNQKEAEFTIEELTEDSSNKALVLYIDSPGGLVYNTDEIYQRLLNYKSKGKKIYAYLGPIAASGGYYIACAADIITANRNSATGSIGVIAGTSIDLTEFLQKYGVKITTITAGENKNMMNFDAPLTEEQKQIAQSWAAEVYDQFVSIVSENRNLPESEVRSLADGRIYTASQAHKLHLIDSIDTFNNALDSFKADISDDNIDVRHIYIERSKKLTSTIFDSLIQAGILSLSKSLHKTLFAGGNYSHINQPVYMYRQ
ncbi:MAG: signal peptide peptidase SppA [Bacteroides sp.]|nr:signal peptide peptidase SppA [Prevotella sp.]MCM1407766.1 signal peptide peptidase SppA [Treponema brennaborense]MCM1468886.1 signal peptide peptidase SppA [Bacteroides sp.]